MDTRQVAADLVRLGSEGSCGLSDLRQVLTPVVKSVLDEIPIPDPYLSEQQVVERAIESVPGSAKEKAKVLKISVNAIYQAQKGEGVSPKVAQALGYEPHMMYYNKLDTGDVLTSRTLNTIQEWANAVLLVDSFEQAEVLVTNLEKEARTIRKARQGVFNDREVRDKILRDMDDLFLDPTQRDLAEVTGVQACHVSRMFKPIEDGGYEGPVPASVLNYFDLKRVRVFLSE